jgi:hypothetical protein
LGEGEEDQSAAWYVSTILLIQNEHEHEQKQQNHNPTVLTGATNTNQNMITHNSKWENRLPKYGSQTETTIDSCV